MQATAWKNTASEIEGSIYGIRVGLVNRREHFPDETWEEVDLRIEGRFHTFRLLGGFWRKCPEIRDDEVETIRNWLHHHSLTWEPGNPPHVQLIPLGGRRFELLPG